MTTVEYVGNDPSITIKSSSRTKTRLRVLFTAVAAAMGIAFIAEGLLGLDLRAPIFDGRATGFDINSLTVLFTSLTAAAAGWAALGVLERLTSYAYRIWTALAVVMLLVSLGGPLSGTGVSAANRISLLLMHVAVAAVLIAGFRPRRGDAS